MSPSLHSLAGPSDSGDSGDSGSSSDSSDSGSSGASGASSDHVAYGCWLRNQKFGNIVCLC